jgi:hypothetical protein
MPAGGGCLISPAWGCLGYQIFILGAVPEARSHSLGFALGWRGRVTLSELLINVVTENKCKLLNTPEGWKCLGQKARG